MKKVIGFCAIATFALGVFLASGSVSVSDNSEFSLNQLTSLTAASASGESSPATPSASQAYIDAWGPRPSAAGYVATSCCGWRPVGYEYDDYYAWNHPTAANGGDQWIPGGRDCQYGEGNDCNVSQGRH